jgi:hypothetical protein
MVERKLFGYCSEIRVGVSNKLGLYCKSRVCYGIQERIRVDREVEWRLEGKFCNYQCSKEMYVIVDVEGQELGMLQ